MFLFLFFHLINKCKICVLFNYFMLFCFARSLSKLKQLTISKKIQFNSGEWCNTKRENCEKSY